MCLFTSVQLFVTPGTAARQAPLSVGFFRQEYRGGCQVAKFSGGTSWSGNQAWVSCLLHCRWILYPLSHLWIFTSIKKFARLKNSWERFLQGVTESATVYLRALKCWRSFRVWHHINSSAHHFKYRSGKHKRIFYFKNKSGLLKTVYLPTDLWVAIHVKKYLWF